MGIGRSHLSSQCLAQLKDVTYFSDQEIRDWYKTYQKMVPSGQMDLKQFLEFWIKLLVSDEKKRVFDQEELKTYGTQLFRQMDRNNDGTVDFRELLMNLSIEKRGSLDQKLELIFSLYDLDKNGYVTRPEMHEFIKVVNKAVDFGGRNQAAVAKLTPDQLADHLAHQIFWKLDRNKDGKLTLNEFIIGIKSEPVLVDYFLGKRPDARDSPNLPYAH